MGHDPTLLGTQRVRPQLSHCGARRPVGEAVILQDDTAHTQSKIPVTYNTPHSGSWLTQTLSLTLFPLIHSAPATPASYYSSMMPSLFLPQGLCTYCSLLLESSSARPSYVSLPQNFPDNPM